MCDSFLGEIRAFAFQFAPQGWAECNGQQLPVNNNQVLFSLLSYNFGGSGSYFKLPNLANTAPIGFGAAPGLTAWQFAQTGGSNTVGLTLSNMPAHTHSANADTVVDPETNNPVNKYISADGVNFVYIKEADVTKEVQMAPSALSPSGSGSPHENRRPGLAMIYCISIAGEYPVRPS